MLGLLLLLLWDFDFTFIKPITLAEINWKKHCELKHRDLFYSRFAENEFCSGITEIKGYSLYFSKLSFTWENKFFSKNRLKNTKNQGVHLGATNPQDVYVFGQINIKNHVDYK